jgi:hypothetical protein
MWLANMAQSLAEYHMIVHSHNANGFRSAAESIDAARALRKTVVRGAAFDREDTRFDPPAIIADAQTEQLAFDTTVTFTAVLRSSDDGIGLALV